MRWTVTAVVAAAGLLAAMAGPARAAETSDPAFATELAAVIAATSAANPLSVREDREYVGAILRRGDDYLYTTVPGQAGADRIRARLPVPAGCELVAIWHTHGAAGSTRHLFSRFDGDLVVATGRPLYLADATGALRVLKPGAPRLPARAARALGLPAAGGFAAGETLRGPEGEPVHIPTRADRGPVRVAGL